jgi:hypothetical protein
MSGRVSVLIAEDCLPPRDTDYRALLTDADICMPAMGGIYLHKENLRPDLETRLWRAAD